MYPDSFFMLISIDLPSSFIEKNFTQQQQQQQDDVIVVTSPQPCEKSKEAILNEKKEKLERTLSKSSIDNKPIFMIYTKCESVEDVNKVRKSLWRIPISNRMKTIWWIYTWPIKCILTITIPNPKTYRRLYPLSFIMCILWIGLNAYMIVWMLTVVGKSVSVLERDMKWRHIHTQFFFILTLNTDCISCTFLYACRRTFSGYTFKIPDAVMGLTFLAAGGCMPEGISSVLMIRKGEGGVGVSNSLGANSLAILMSLGIPWMIKNILNMNTAGKQSIPLNPYSTEYNMILLLFAVISLYVVLTFSKYRLKRTVGLMLLSIYIICITFGILLEMNVFFPDIICS